MRRRRRYIWLHGVLGWGLPVGIAHAALMAFVYRERNGYLGELLLSFCSLPLWLVGGYFWGRFMWRLHEEGMED